MKLPHSPAKIAGFILLLSAVFPLGIWYVLLFTNTPSTLGVMDAAFRQIQFSFSEESGTLWFYVWLAVLPVLCLAIGVSYLLNVAHHRSGAIVLLVGTIAGLAGSLAFTNWSEGLGLALAAFFCARCVRGA